MQDIFELRELIQNWYIWRDMGDWDRLRTIWHPGGKMAASWREGPFEEFIAANQKGWGKGLSILHQPGASSIDLNGNRAVSITKMIISQRAVVNGVLCDVNCLARHHDLWEKRNGRWGLMMKDTIFDKDRIDPVNSGEVVKLDAELLNSFPEGYRYLGYLQSSIGYKVNKNKATLFGEPVEKMYARGRAWLAGASFAELFPEQA
jgi:hypothetical protein